MTRWMIGLLIAVATGTPSVVGQDDPTEVKLEERHAAALEDLETRDPEAHRRATALIEAGAMEEVLAFLGEHADYLDWIGAVGPELRRAFQEQEIFERRARLHRDKVAAAEGPKATREAIAELRGVVEEWFELRGRIAELELEAVLDEQKELSKLLSSRTDKEEEAAAEWCERILAGGVEGIRKRRAEAEEGLSTLAAERLSLLVELLVSKELISDEVAVSFLEIAEKGDADFVEVSLRGFEKKFPDESFDVNERREPHEKMTRFVMSACEAALQRLKKTQGKITPEIREVVTSVCEQIVWAEASAVAEELTEVMDIIRRQRDRLSLRDERRDVLIAIQLGRLLEGTTELEW